MSPRIRVGIIFGGRSGEHEVSLRSARSILDALDQNRYEPILIGIDHEGRWHLQEAARALLPETKGPLVLEKSSPTLSVTPCGESTLVSSSPGGMEALAVDVFFPVLHGTYGEDGTIQGLLEMADVPYVGSGVLGSSVGMDKDVAKRLLRDAGIPIVDYVVARASQRDSLDIAQVEKKIGYPCFIKPANMGSSVGVHKAKSRSELEKSLNDAFKYDTKVLIEKAVNAREIECAVLGNEAPRASLAGEIIPNAEFYSYQAKYIDDNGAALEIPAQIPEGLHARIRRMAVETFRALELEGLARVDFFLDKTTEEVFVNEVNTIPGFTSISMYPKLWEAAGIPYAKLVDTLLQLAIDRYKTRKALSTKYEA